MTERDYYRILQVHKEATEAEIKRAYRRLALQYHPDRNPSDHSAEEKFKEVNGAYAVLADPEKRKRYDRYGPDDAPGRYHSKEASWYTPGFSPNRPTPFFFGRGMGCRKRARFWRGYSSHFWEQAISQAAGNFIYSIEITPEQALCGTEKVLIVRQRWGSKSYRLTIPPGVKSGAILELALGGEGSIFKNLSIQVTIKEPPASFDQKR